MFFFIKGIKTKIPDIELYHAMNIRLFYNNEHMSVQVTIIFKTTYMDMNNEINWEVCKLKNTFQLT